MTFSKTPHIARLAATAALIALLSPPVDTARFPFDPSRGLVEVEGTLNGVLSGRFGLDTGADLFYIDREFARRAGLSIPADDHGKVVRGIHGVSAVASAKARSFAIGDERIYNVPVEIIDLKKLSGVRGQTPDGLIGYEALRRFYITIDYPGRRIDLFSHEPGFDPNSVRGVPFEQVGHLIVVNCEVEGVEMSFFLDYCASSTLLTPGALAKLNRDSRRPLKSITLGDVSAADIPFVVRALDNFSDPRVVKLDGILGYSFLRRFRVTVDYGRKLLLFHR
ncbi:MAG: aspartyl protease family protein [Candidatus Zixiibacteriota bacterium]